MVLILVMILVVWYGSYACLINRINDGYVPGAMGLAPGSRIRTLYLDFYIILNAIFSPPKKQLFCPINVAFHPKVNITIKKNKKIGKNKKKN